MMIDPKHVPRRHEKQRNEPRSREFVKFWMDGKGEKDRDRILGENTFRIAPWKFNIISFYFFSNLRTLLPDNGGSHHQAELGGLDPTPHSHLIEQP